MFPAYVENPTNCFFEGQDSDEYIILLLRAHPITNLSWIILVIFVFLLPTLIPLFIKFLNLSLFSLPPDLIYILVLVDYLIGLVIIFEGFLSWYFNVYILTNKKLVDIDFNSILHKNIDLAPLTQVQETSSPAGGLMGIIFDFGDVLVQTAGANVSMDFHKVPHPHRVSDRIMDEVLKKGQNGSGGS